MFGIKTILGLPVHVLIVHFAVVLVPLGAIALIAIGWHSSWRSHLSLATMLVCLAGAGAAVFAAQTGGELRRSLRTEAATSGARLNFGSHPGDGDIARIFAVLLALVAVGVWLNERRDQSKRWPVAAVYGISAVVAVAAIVTMTIAGHTGATLVWRDVGNFVSPR